MRLKILVIKCNQLSGLTLNSIRKNMPDWEFDVVDYNGGFIRTALMNSEEICLVVKSGVILDIQEGDCQKNRY